MGHNRISMGMNDCRAICLVILLLSLISCSSNGTKAIESASKTDHLDSPVRVSADWLSTQTGERIEGFGFYLLNQSLNSVIEWDRLSVSMDVESETSEFILTGIDDFADDIYLHVTYPGDQFSVDEVWLTESRRDEYLLLSMPKRSENLLTIGISRIGSKRDYQSEAGEILRIKFKLGAERVYRAISNVTNDPLSKVEIVGGDTGPSWLDISWDERNPGDYNNNGLVEVADLTPVGMYFEQHVASSQTPANLDIVDGNQDGYVTVQDITPIGKNWDRSVNGYRVFQKLTPGDPVDDSDTFMQFDIKRSDVVNNTPQDERKQRLHYEYNLMLAEQDSYVYVRPYSDSGEGSVGLHSNVLQVPISTVNHPPIWETVQGIHSLVPTVDGFEIHFGKATDIDGDDIDYEIRYIESTSQIGDPGTQWIVIPETEVIPSSDTTFVYLVEDKTPGETYRVRVDAADENGNYATGIEKLVTLPSPLEGNDIWPLLRKDIARTGSNPLATLTEPVALDWEKQLDWEDTNQQFTTLVIGEQGWVCTADFGGSIAAARLKEFSLTDGTELDSFLASFEDEPFYLALGTESMVLSHNSGFSVRERESGSSSGIFDYGTLNCGPLCAGDFLIIPTGNGDLLMGISSSTDYDHYDPVGVVSYSISPFLNDGNVIAVSDNGLLSKHSITDFLNPTTVQLTELPRGNSMAVDRDNDLLYLMTDESLLIKIDTDDLSVVGSLPKFFGDEQIGSPCLVLHTTPRLAVVAVKRTDEVVLTGVDLSTFTVDWETPLSTEPESLSVTAGQSRLFTATTDGDLFIHDFNGYERQRVSLGKIAQSEAVLSQEKLAVMCGDMLKCFKSVSDTDGPPVWVGTAGVESLTTGDSQVTLNWDYAVDDHQEPVHYVIYYRQGAAPNLTTPGPGTTIIHSIPHTDLTHQYIVDELENGERYYFAVRAYDGVWGDSPNIDSNTRILATTPPWQEERLITGTDLPAGEIFYMRGLTDPSGNMHLVYNDWDTGHLVHLWEEDGNWQYEGDNLSTYIAQGFSPAYNIGENRLEIGWARYSVGTGVITRTGADSWSNHTFIDSMPTQNPQVSLAIGNELALGYTQNIVDVTVEYHVDYYLKRTDTLIWQAMEPLEETNLSGREIHVLLDPADDESPWVALQRGGESTPNRHTPEEGELGYARWNTVTPGFDYETVDSGDNAPNSDCGKRVRQLIDSSGNVHLAYLDLDSSSEGPQGQLKYAYYDGSTWTIEVVDGLDISFQTASLQYTYGELGFALSDSTGTEEPVIAILIRNSASSPGSAHLSTAAVWRRNGGSWDFEQIADSEWAFPRDREPCVLLITPDDVLHVFYVSVDDEDTEMAANALFHRFRPVV